MSNNTGEMYLGEWTVSYEWPRIRKTHGSRGGGKSQDQVRRTALHRLIADARKQFWEARHTSPIVNRAIEVGLAEGLEEAEALLLAVAGLLEENHKSGTWSAVPPIVDGWWWYKDDELKCPVILRLREAVFVSNEFVMEHGANYFLARPGARWFTEPVTPPEDLDARC